MAKTATLKPVTPLGSPPPPAREHTAPASFAMLSHRGRVRRENQDTCAALPGHGAFVVCDGIGGAAGGEIASRLAADAFLQSISQAANQNNGSNQNGNLSGETPYPPDHPGHRLHTAIHAANGAVYRYSLRAPKLSGMGTTLVAALWDASATHTLRLANVGDSRCYRLRAGRLEQLTQDHSLVEEQVRAGTLSRIEAAASPIRNIITRAIGSQLSVEADISAHPVEPGDLYLLTSDGLTRELEDDAIARILTRAVADASTANLESACQALIDAANDHGGADNITVLLLACE
jgi:serine/threonine protein phosphatase PrpC